ncbi:hypothetical protein CTAYLR_001635 [Chrysophaeum taylorii]|uniref:Uncharacterized protein n=1 Tax=Chrysophaeum taylorii TaxID=2483200 RepID=A0AAD7XKW6_9STRA|nr:hypothetical protein CTAYLR_001635 [Chrysophaeum taylorii]
MEEEAFVGGLPPPQLVPTQPASGFRRGKWTPEEQDYAEHLITSFTAGTVANCDEGITLRAFLARELRCDRMRISKKFAGASIGKLIFRRRGPPDAETERRLKELRDAFQRSVSTFPDSFTLGTLYQAAPAPAPPTEDKKPPAASFVAESTEEASSSAPLVIPGRGGAPPPPPPPPPARQQQQPPPPPKPPTYQADQQQQQQQYRRPYPAQVGDEFQNFVAVPAHRCVAQDPAKWFQQPRTPPLTTVINAASQASNSQLLAAATYNAHKAQRQHAQHKDGGAGYGYFHPQQFRYEDDDRVITDDRDGALLRRQLLAQCAALIQKSADDRRDSEQQKDDDEERRHLSHHHGIASLKRSWKEAEPASTSRQRCNADLPSVDILNAELDDDDDDDDAAFNDSLNFLLGEHP